MSNYRHPKMRALDQQYARVGGIAAYVLAIYNDNKSAAQVAARLKAETGIAVSRNTLYKWLRRWKDANTERGCEARASSAIL